MMRDVYGSLFTYYVDTRVTATDSFNDGSDGTGIYNPTTEAYTNPAYVTPDAAMANAITVKTAAAGSDRTTTAIYAIVSNSRNELGAIGKNGVCKSATSAHNDEKANCNLTTSTITCTSCAAADNVLVQRIYDEGVDNNDYFDDFVVFKQRWQLQDKDSSAVRNEGDSDD
jgi:hypothetical protein